MTHSDAKSPTSRQRLGEQAELLACHHLEQRGFRLLLRNFRCKTGEIDLVMRDGSTIVFVEVRYRRDNRFGGALASVDFRKQRKLVNTARFFMQKYDPALKNSYRFDVVAIEGTPDHNASIQWIGAAF